jgi:hypothetical protein
MRRRSITNLFADTPDLNLRSNAVAATVASVSYQFSVFCNLSTLFFRRDMKERPCVLDGVTLALNPNKFTSVTKLFNLQQYRIEHRIVVCS